MNKQRLQDIANNTRFVNDNDVVEIKQLIAKYPFYVLPHVVLAKIFFEKEHYLFENALTQAAMRVTDREWLYHYVHGDQPLTVGNDGQTVAGNIVEVTTSIDMPAETEVLENAFIGKKIEKTEPEEDTIVKNDLSAFLEELPEVDAVVMVVPEEEDIVVIEDERQVVIEQVTLTDSEEETGAEEEITETDIAETAAEEAATLNIALNLRKHPVYNVEEFLQSEKEVDESEEKDFFYWLEHPQPEEKKTEEKPEEPAIPEKGNKLSIIDQFIMANPGISRPKKEFFNAENMAKKSEQLNNDFVTETLANIYYEQGNIDLAIDAYEKLSLQNPLKQAYFASLIEKIKKEKR